LVKHIKKGGGHYGKKERKESQERHAKEKCKKGDGKEKNKKGREK
jgi:hypothetical protein